ncbi:DUF6153 family protein [Saccharopolyspora cebuensis]|uniref:DUF6153 family protein n=1 Tax=Saccharopolyspora cebuensis TaxID=418759 RepID=A0ABV4CMQ6_9PSEU
MPRATARFVLLALVLFGVVAMHQLPVGHGADGGGEHEPTPPAAAQSAQAHHGAAHQPDEPADDGGAHSVLHLCLAILIGAAGLLALRGRLPRAPRTLLPGPGQHPGAAPGRRPPARTTPTVYALRVLRL